MLGTRFVLRATRPWHAFFEERLGEFPALPSEWMEGVRLVRCPGGGVEWLGRRHPMAAYEEFDFSGFREMPGGWTCGRPAVPEMDDALHAEVNQVLAEIAEFSEHILPEMALMDPCMFPRERRVSRLGERRWDKPPLIDWQLAAARLAGALTAETASLPRIYNVDEFGDFLWQEPGTPYFIENGRIRWLMHECYRQSWEVDYMPEAFRPNDPRNKEQYLTALKRWLLDPQARTANLERAFYWAIHTIADMEPEFVRNIMDVRTWRERIRTNTALTEAERQDELSETYCMFNYALNNALLHLLAGISDNHFMDVRKFLDLPSFRGGYAGYLPEYLLQVLFTKVQVFWSKTRAPARCILPTEHDPRLQFNCDRPSNYMTSHRYQVIANINQKQTFLDVTPCDAASASQSVRNRHQGEDIGIISSMIQWNGPLRNVRKMRGPNDGKRSLVESIMLPQVVATLTDWQKGLRTDAVLIGGVARSFYVRRFTRTISIY